MTEDEANKIVAHLQELVDNKVDFRLLKDGNDVYWVFNGERVYSILAELEFIEDGEDVEQNGYPCTSFFEARQILVDYGYME